MSNHLVEETSKSDSFEGIKCPIVSTDQVLVGVDLFCSVSDPMTWVLKIINSINIDAVTSLFDWQIIILVFTFS